MGRDEHTHHQSGHAGRNACCLLGTSMAHLTPSRLPAATTVPLTTRCECCTACVARNLPAVRLRVIHTHQPPLCPALCACHIPSPCPRAHGARVGVGVHTPLPGGPVRLSRQKLVQTCRQTFARHHLPCQCHAAPRSLVTKAHTHPRRSAAEASTIRGTPPGAADWWPHPFFAIARLIERSSLPAPKREPSHPTRRREWGA